MSSRVFISYTSRDTDVDDFALARAKSLFSSFAHVFVDRLSPKSHWHPQLIIIWQVIRSHLLVVIETQSVYHSPWVWLELVLAKLTLTPIIKVPVATLQRDHDKLNLTRACTRTFETPD